MSQDSFTEFSHESWFSRIGGAITGILIGFVLLVIAFPLLFWNEGRTVKEYKTLKEGGGAVISVNADTVDPANAGKLIHVTGKAETEATLIDPVFGVSANALKMYRNVEMFQWKETSESKTKKKVGGGTDTVKHYSYDKVWSDKVINSRKFKKAEGHQNPGSLTYKSSEFVAQDISLGAFTLSPSLISKIVNFEPYPLESDSTIPESISDKAKLYDAGFYFGSNPAAPQIGDILVKFKIAPMTEVSVIAKQVGNTFEPYSAKTGGTLELLETGVYSAEAMIQQAQARNKVMSWILRFAGFLLMLVGFVLIFRPFSVLADVLPILGNIVGAGTGIIAFLLAAILTLITIAIAWIVYRPLLGILLIIVAIGLIWVIRGKMKSSKTAR